MKIFQSSFTGTSSVYFSFYSYNIQQCSISRIATCTEGRFHWYWQNQYVLLNTQIHLLPSVTNENTDDVMIWYDMVLRMLVFIRHQTGVNHEHVSHGRLPRLPLAIPWDNAAAEPCPLSGDNWWVLLPATWDRRHCTLGHLHGLLAHHT